MESVKKLISELENKQPDLTSEIKQVNNIFDKVCELMSTHKKASEEINKSAEEITRLEKDQQGLVAKLQSGVKDFFDIAEKFENLQHEFTSLAEYEEYTSAQSQINKTLEYVMDLYGLKIDLKPMASDVLAMKIKFSEGKYVILTHNISKMSYELLDMQPKPQQYKQIQHFLHTTADIVGFLYYTKQFFNQQPSGP